VSILAILEKRTELARSALECGDLSPLFSQLHEQRQVRFIFFYYLEATPRLLQSLVFNLFLKSGDKSPHSKALRAPFSL
jgi:hypothetical protein